MVAEALACASRFMFVHSPALSIGVEPDPRGWEGVIALTYRKDVAESPYSPQAMELGIGLFHQTAVNLLGERTGLRSVELPHQPLSPVQRYADFFGVDVRFGAPVAALRVERRILDATFTGADEGTNHGEILDDVRRTAARSYLTTTDLPLTQVAALLGFSEQSALSHAVRRWHGASPRQVRSSAELR